MCSSTCSYNKSSDLGHSDDHNSLQKAFTSSLHSCHSFLQCGPRPLCLLSLSYSVLATANVSSQQSPNGPSVLPAGFPEVTPVSGAPDVASVPAPEITPTDSPVVPGRQRGLLKMCAIKSF